MFSLPVKAVNSANSVDFNRDVRPILAAKCYACHGPDANQRKAKLRLDSKDAALQWSRDGHHAIVPKNVAKSLLVARIRSTDDTERMPPPESGKELTGPEIELLARWIQEGAEWREHWAYVMPRRWPAPEVGEKSWVRTPVDAFVLARLEKEQLQPSPEADPVTALRRLTFDVTGLPPTPQEIEAFISDPTDAAYEKQVDRLLRSPHYGERIAAFWLDLVRFADTRGYHSDNPRSVSPYRDYVIRSFNDNMPFNQFTIEQLAGDLLPESTLSQRVASCYNKLLQTTEEGGAQAKEYEAISSADRVRNVSVVWMGATLGCAQCHEHKFDPYPARDFYAMAAFFADIAEASIHDQDAGIPVPTSEQKLRLDSLDTTIVALEKALEDPSPAVAVTLDAAQSEWEQSLRDGASVELGPWHAIGPFSSKGGEIAFHEAAPPESEIDLTKTYDKLKWRKEPGWTDGAAHELEGKDARTYLYRTVESLAGGFLPLSLGSAGGIKVWVNDALIFSRLVVRDVEPDQDFVTLPLRKGVNRVLLKISNGDGGSGFYFQPILGIDTLPEAIRTIVEVPVGDRSGDQRATIAAFYRSVSPILSDSRIAIERRKKEKRDLEETFTRCVVSRAGDPRTVRVLPRGNWMDESGAVVKPAIPQYFGKLDTGKRRATRLDLAKWFVAADNPLTARAFVNRLWKLFFGKGISQRLDDLGAMGEAPSHPELLDWIAVEFIESGWDVKHIVKLLVMSSVYRQSSVARPELENRDPYNRLLARQSRWRLEAESVRDNALAISGLLSRRVGGPSVKPYQPAGYWVHLNFPKRTWAADPGEKAYRRGLYTWWQRSFLHPSLMAFDAPNREECTAERPRSNIPQQALVLLNDPTYVEAARVFGYRILTESDATRPAARVRWAFQQAVSRAPDADELTVLVDLYEAHRDLYGKDPEAATAVMSVGLASLPEPLPEGVVLSDLAAWTSVARTILNLHETVTRN